MKTLVLGASGATGKQLVSQLIDNGQQVRVIVRPGSAVVTEWSANSNIELVEEHIAEISVDEMALHLKNCDSVASCLGHNLNWKGIYGKPRKLVAGAVKLVCDAANHNQQAIKLALMNTAGKRNHGLKESVGFAEKMIIAILKALLPPHADNEAAADYLQTQIGQNHPYIQWAVIRPDTLLNEETVSEYTIHPSPTTSAIFKAGKTSRINVGHFMAQLLTDEALWKKWSGQMPIIYNKAHNGIA
jgi:NAD(P)-dependent dehydrogenase (short-subunit alcohol dehydrogenase family)